MDSILTSIKKLLGPSAENNDFDDDIIMHINSVLMILTQMGVGPSEGFTIYDDSAIWEEFTLDNTKIESVKTYVYLKVRLLFDPPTNSTVMESIKEMIKELEWRLNSAVDF